MLRFKSPRRLIRFSLRLVLVTVALVGVFVRLVVLPAERQRALACFVTSLGGEVQYDERWIPIYDEQGRVVDVTSKYDCLPFGEKLYEWLPRAYLDSIVGIYLANSDRLTDHDVVRFAAAPELESLDLDCTPVTNGAVEYFRTFNHLEELEIKGTNITKEGVARIRAVLPNCRISWRADLVGFGGGAVSARERRMKQGNHVPRSKIADKGRRAAVRVYKEAPGAREKGRMGEGSKK